MHGNPFSDAEIARRLDALRAGLADRGLDGAVVAAPENVFYLTGLEIREGMSFHVLSWLMGTGRGDFFLSNAVLLGPGGAEVLTRTPNGPLAR